LPLACPSAASAWSRTERSSCSSASPTARSRRSPLRCRPARGSRTSAARRRSRALDPHTRRFALHPLQTLTRARGPEQLDGAWAAISAETEEGLAQARALADLLGLRPFELADSARPLYHAGAAIASNFLVTIQRTAADLFDAAGAPPEALVPLMTRTIENDFELTGPIARGDWATVDAHVSAIRESRPELEELYRVLAEVTAR